MTTGTKWPNTWEHGDEDTGWVHPSLPETATRRPVPGGHVSYDVVGFLASVVDPRIAGVAAKAVLCE